MDHMMLVGLGLLVPVRMRRQFWDAPKRPNHLRRPSRPRPTPHDRTGHVTGTEDARWCVVVGFSLAACQGDGDATATATFRECLERNHIEPEPPEVTLRGDAIDTISLQITSEGELSYEPDVRLACTEKVEN